MKYYQKILQIWEQDLNPIQETFRTLNRQDQKRLPKRHIIIEVSDIQNEDRSLKVTREKMEDYIEM